MAALKKQTAGPPARPRLHSTRFLFRPLPSLSYRFVNSNFRSLLQTLLELDGRSVVQTDLEQVRLILDVHSRGLGADVEYPLLGCWIRADCGVWCCRIICLIDRCERAVRY